MTDGQIAFAIEKLKENKAIDGGDAAKLGIGIVTVERYKKIYDFLVAGGLIDPRNRLAKGPRCSIRQGPQDRGAIGAAMNAIVPGEPLHESTNPVAAGGAQPPAVEILSAEKVFSNGTPGLAPIDLAVADGEFLTLIGPSGCGKSTLHKLIANLIEPSDGRLLWWRGEFGNVGQDGRRFAFVFQEPTLMPWARVDANVRLPLELADVAKAKRRRSWQRRSNASACPNLPGTFRASFPAA